ncbi:MAG: hypothetical protein WAW07_16595 [Bacteroidales bacterium]
MATYLIVTLIVTITLVVLSNLPLKPKSKSVMDELNANPEFRKLSDLYEAMSKLNEGGTDQDTLPNGYGEFGYDITNPIPVNTVFGNTAYLSRLRTLDGVKVEYERIGSYISPISDHPIDGYEIYTDGQRVAVLYVDPYNKKNSRRAPRNFNLIL